MGLLDVLTGMRNGPRGFGGGGGGMSPITMALLGLLAYKAVRASVAQASAHIAPMHPAGSRPGRPAGLTICCAGDSAAPVLVRVWVASARS